MKLTNSSGKAIKKYDETLYDKVLWNSQEPVIDNGDKLVMKLGMGKFCSFKDFDEFYNAWSADENRHQKPIFEYIKNNTPHCLYWDIDSYNKRSLEAFCKLLYSFVMKNIKYYFPYDTYEDFLKCLHISSNVRDKTIDSKIVQFYSHHIVYRSDKMPLVSENFTTLWNFNNYFVNYIENDLIDDDEINLRKFMYKDDAQYKTSGIVLDLMVYPKNGKGRAFRTVLSPKCEGEIHSSLKPIRDDDERLHFPSYNAQGTSMNIPPEWGYTKHKKSTNTTQVVPLTVSSEIPKYIQKRAIKHFKEFHPEGKFVSSEILPTGDYCFKFLDYNCRCLIHNRKHTDMTGNNYQIYYKNGKYLYYCWSCEKDNPKPEPLILKHKPDLLVWDYEYDDRVEEYYSDRNKTDLIDCLPMVLPEEIGIGGTFILQSNKGTGKTESLDNLMRNLSDDTTVLFITYRRTLVAKYASENEKFGMISYLDKNTEQNRYKRFITCLDSLYKLNPCEIGFDSYDIIVIDELYSVLEHFDSNLMNKMKLNVMMVFEKHINNCKYLYGMDANIENKLVINTVRALRNPDKIIYHKNPLVHNYEDYTFEFNETRRVQHIPADLTEDDVGKDIIKLEFIHKIIQDLKKGKKIYVASSTKTFVEELDYEIKQRQSTDELPDFKVLVYTSQTDSETKDNQLKDVYQSWGEGDVRLVIASPTISAGISFNSIDDIRGFHKQYVYAKIGQGVASMHTLIQQMIRIRQLIDKHIVLLFDNQISGFELEPDEIVNALHNRTELLYKNLSIPYKQSMGLDDNWKQVFDESDWTFVLWLEIQKAKCYYSNPIIFKQTIREKYCNHPTHPYSSGYGMRWVDNGTKTELDQETHEKMKKDKESLLEMKKQEEADKFITLPPLSEIEYKKILDRIKSNQTVNSEEMGQYTLFRLCDDYNITFDDVRETWADATDEKRKEFATDFKRLMNMSFRSVYKLNCDWVSDKFNNSMNREEIQKIIELLNTKYYESVKGSSACEFYSLDTSIYKKSLKSLPADQCMNWWKKKIQYIPSIWSVCVKLGIEPFTDLSETDINIENLTELLQNRGELKKWWTDLENENPDLQNSIRGDKSNRIQAGINWREYLRSWQNENPQKHIYDVDRTEFDELFKDKKYTPVPDELKPSAWKSTSNSKNPNTSKMAVERLKEGSFITSEMKRINVDWWDEKTVISCFEKVFKPIGYEFRSIREKGKPTTGFKLDYDLNYRTINKYKKTVEELIFEFDE